MTHIGDGQLEHVVGGLQVHNFILERHFSAGIHVESLTWPAVGILKPHVEPM